MKNTWKATAAFAAIVLCAGMSACGTSDASDSGKSSGTSSSSAAASFDPSTVETDETIAALVPDYVKKDGKLTVGTDTTYAPAEFIGEDGKTAVGYDVDLTKAIAKVMGLEPETAVSEFDMIIPSIGSKYDIGISSFTVTPERQEAVDFVTYYKAGSTWVTPEGQSRQGRHEGPVWRQGRSADRHHPGGGAQQDERAVQGRWQRRPSNCRPSPSRPM
jgi:polar amino acid transport system substrate-binding protein